MKREREGVRRGENEERKREWERVGSGGIEESRSGKMREMRGSEERRSEYGKE